MLDCECQGKATNLSMHVAIVINKRCYAEHVVHCVRCQLTQGYCGVIQVEESEMVKSLKETDMPEPWFGKKSGAPTAPKRTKVTPKQMPALVALEVEAEGQGMNRGKGRGKGKNNENAAGKEKTKVKYDRTGPAVIGAGRTKNPVADPDELRRKRIEDALACGRVVKTILHPEKRRNRTKSADTESSEQEVGGVLAPLDKELGSASPLAVEALAHPGGKTS